MMTFDFEYKGHNITLTNSFSGREQVLVDGELVSNKLNWGRKSTHAITIEQEELLIAVEVESLATYDVTVRLMHEDEVIASQSRSLGANFGEDYSLSESERQWSKELELDPSASLNMYALYFGIMLFVLLPIFTGDDVYQVVGLVAIGLAMLWAVTNFVITSWQDLRKKESPELLSEV